MSSLQTSRGDLYNSFPEIPKGQYQTNNIYKDFPPLMNDGRTVLASWQPGETVNKKIMESSGVTTNWQYRKYLMENANQIREENFKLALNDTGFFIRHDQPQDNSFRTPRLFQTEDKVTASDLKETYLSREELADRRVIPVMTQAELMKIWSMS